MQVKGLSWLVLRTPQFEEMVTFFRDVLGMQPFVMSRRLPDFNVLMALCLRY